MYELLLFSSRYKTRLSNPLGIEDFEFDAICLIKFLLGSKYHFLTSSVLMTCNKINTKNRQILISVINTYVVITALGSRIIPVLSRLVRLGRERLVGKQNADM